MFAYTLPTMASTFHKLGYDLVIGSSITVPCSLRDYKLGADLAVPLMNLIHSVISRRGMGGLLLRD